MRVSRVRLAALCLVNAVAALTLAGCSNGSTVSQSAASMAQPKSFTNRQLHFAMTYDAGKLRPSLVQSDTDLSDRGGFITVDFLDQDSSNRLPPFGGRGRLRVFVQEMGLPRQASPPPPAAMRKTFSQHFLGDGVPMSTARRHLEGLTVSGVEAVSRNGMTGYRAVYAWDGAKIVVYWLFKGRRVYEFNLGARTSAWPSIGPVYEAALRSFTITP